MFSCELVRVPIGDNLQQNKEGGMIILLPLQRIAPRELG
jgi:hypothetical protein